MRVRVGVLAAAGLLLSVVPAVSAQTASRDAVKRTADGHPDFSGSWHGGAAITTRLKTKSIFQGGDAPRVPTRAQLTKNLPLTPKGQELVAEYLKNDGAFGGETTAAEDPRYHAVPCGAVSPAEVGSTGVEVLHAGGLELVQNSKRLLMVYTGSDNKWVRMVWIGRQHPKDLTDYDPTWMGHSVGTWDGDTLVVDTVRIKTTPGELIDSNIGAPQGPNLHMIERISLSADGKLHVDKTFEDPDLYTHPWTKSVVFARETNWDALADGWEVQDPHMVCEGGRYPSDNDVFIQGPPKN